MLFNSYIFIFVFLPIVLIIYYTLNKYNLKKLALASLIVSSLIFYGYFNLSYLWIIIISILFNFTINKLMQKSDNNSIRKLLLIIALTANLGMFVYFKYTNFFIDNINAVFGTDFFVHRILLPLGISFFTFQQLSYVIDCYKRQVPDYSFLNYAAFVAFFPQLIAGPIVTHDEIIPQFEDETKKKFNYENFSKGIFAFALGLAKKVLIADTFGLLVANGYSDISALNSTSAIIVILSYTFQIYFDFSGYCDMATGLGLMFNIDIPMNFNSPYKATTITDFWQRWHITLTRFFKKYLYFPLGGNRKGTVRTYINIFIIFVVSGFWHGANWTFILWGTMHGIASILTRIFSKSIGKIHNAIKWIITFIFVNIAWVFFRAPSIGTANELLGKAISFDFSSADSFIRQTFRMADILIPKDAQMISSGLTTALLIGAAIVVIFRRNTNERVHTFKPTIKASIITTALLILSIISLSGVSTFLYFNF